MKYAEDATASPVQNSTETTSEIDQKTEVTSLSNDEMQTTNDSNQKEIHKQIQHARLRKIKSGEIENSIHHAKTSENVISINRKKNEAQIALRNSIDEARSQLQHAEKQTHDCIKDQSQKLSLEDFAQPSLENALNDIDRVHENNSAENSTLKTLGLELALQEAQREIELKELQFAALLNEHKSVHNLLNLHEKLLESLSINTD